jgi:hypothetical protein
MLSGANAFRISGYKLKPEDRMQQCYMPCGRRNNNSPATGMILDLQTKRQDEPEITQKLNRRRDPEYRE